MAFEKYVKLSGSEREPMPGATKAGSPDPNEVMNVSVILRPRTSVTKLASLDRVIGSGEQLSRQEYEARYGADPADVRKVQAFAAAHGLAVANVNLATRTVQLTGRCCEFAAAFKVSMTRYEYGGTPFRGRTGHVNIPTELNKIVLGVHGLDNRPQARAHFRLASNSRKIAPKAAAATSFTPLQIAQSL